MQEPHANNKYILLILGLIGLLLIFPYAANVCLRAQLSLAMWADFFASYTVWFQCWKHPQIASMLMIKTGLYAAGISALPISIYALYALRPKKRQTYGSARFANHKDIKAANLYTDKKEPQNTQQQPRILLGSFKGKYLSYKENRSITLCAPTRAGKGVSIVIPNLLSWVDSVVCLDVKSENYLKTAGFRAQYQPVYKFDPFNKQYHTACYNPLDCVSRDPYVAITDLQTIASVFWNGQSETSDPFWHENARILFVGLACYLLDSQQYLSFTNILHAANHSIGVMDKEDWQQLVVEHRQANMPLSPLTYSKLNQYFNIPSETRNSLLGVFNGALQLFENPYIAYATHRSDFDIRTLRKKRQSIYICIAVNHLKIAQPLLNVFFELLLQENTRELPEHNPDLKYRALLVLDEFTAIGKIDMLAHAISYIAGYHIQLLLIYQSQAQLAGVYGEEDARNILTNCGCQLLFTPREDADAKEYSESLGTYTERLPSHSVSHGGYMKPNSMNYSKTYQDHARPLMMAQEIKRMSLNKLIINIEGQYPILADKIKYYADEAFEERLLPAPASVISMPPEMHHPHQQAKLNNMQQQTIEKDMGTIQVLNHQNQVLLEKPNDKKMEGGA